MKRRTPSRRCSSFASFESLEQRQFLATDFAYGGIQFPASEGAQPAIVFGQGTRAEDGSVTGTRTLATLSGRTVGPIDIATMSFDGRGGMSLTDTAGVHTVAPFGADFRLSAGYPIGFFSSEPQVTAGGSGDLTRYFVELRDTAMTWSAVTYQLVMTRVSEQGVTQVPAEVSILTAGRFPSIIPVAVAIRYEGQEQIVGQIVASPGESGFLLSTGEKLYFSNNANPFLGDAIYNIGATDVVLVDPDASDGFIGVGVGSMNGVGDIDLRAAQGVYRGAFVVASQTGAEYFGTTLGISGSTTAEVVLVLNPADGSTGSRGTYTLFTAAEYMSPTNLPLRTGDWFAEPNSGLVGFTRNQVIRLGATSSSVPDAYLMVGPTRGITAAALQPQGIQGTDPGTEHLTGVMSRYVGTFIERLGSVREVILGDDGRPEVYHAVPDYGVVPPESRWSRYDLIDRAGGEKMVLAELIKHPGRVAGQAYSDLIFGVDVRGHAVIYERSFGGNWRYRDLTAELSANSLVGSTAAFSFWMFDATDGGSLPPPSTLAAHLAPAIVGRDAAGSLVMYALDSTYSFRVGDAIRDEVVWRISDVSESLRSRGIVEPDFSGGRVSGFTTPWGSINLVGRDATGEVVSLWKSPGFEWFVNNLSDLAEGARGFATDLTPYYTTWYSMNITGLDGAGNVIALWWTPATGRWIFSDLTATFDLDPMAVSRPVGGVNTLTAIVNHDYGAISLAGFDANGRVATYWWMPGQTDWKRRDITLGLDAALIPREIVRGSVVGRTEGLYDTEQSYWARSADGKIVRLFWDSPGPDEWVYQNITDVAALNG